MQRKRLELRDPDICLRGRYASFVLIVRLSAIFIFGWNSTCVLICTILEACFSWYILLSKKVIGREWIAFWKFIAFTDIILLFLRLLPVIFPR